MTAPIPLTAPDGTVYAFACSTCRQVGSIVGLFGPGTYTAEDVERVADASREDAERCCVCRRCSQPFVPASSSSHCDACKPLEDVEREARVEAFRAERAARTAARDASLAAALDRLAAEALEAAMSDISEDNWAAGWQIGLEFSLWRMVEGGSRRFGMGEVAEADVAKLADLSARAGGWWEFERFVPIDEWRATYAKHLADNAQVEAALAEAGES